MRNDVHTVDLLSTPTDTRIVIVMLRNLLIYLLFSALIASADNPFSSSQPDYPDYAAFSGLKWNNDQPSVLIDDTWGEFVSIHGVTAKEIITWCHQHIGVEDTEKRFREDLPVVLKLMGHEVPIKTTVQLRIDGKLVTQAITMTEEKRDQINRHPRKEALEKIPQSQQIAAFEDILQKRFAYLEANSADWQKNLSALKERKFFSDEELSFELNRIIALFVDGHASVSGNHKMLTNPQGSLPALIEPTHGRFVVFDPKRKSLINDEFPFLIKIDDIPMREWIDICAPFFPQGSPQFRTRHALRQIRHLNFCREQLKLPLSKTVRLTLANQANDKTLKVDLPVSKSTPMYGKWPRAETADSQIFDNNIGYLRLSSMDEEAERAIHEWMPKFRDTDGLVIDVRDNGGGSRRPLLDIASWLIEKTDPPRIANIAKYRLWERLNKNHLEARFMVRADDPLWTADEKKVITAFAKKFKPEWQPDQSKFSDWHYLLLTPNKPSRPYTYNKPVVILQNSKCFSATDIFLGALKGWKPNITLMGTPSGGGSARSIRHKISKTITVRCASMASFQPNGRLYDGNGIAPDVLVHPEPSSFLHDSQDNQLEAALKFIQSQ